VLAAAPAATRCRVCGKPPEARPKINERADRFEAGGAVGPQLCGGAQRLEPLTALLARTEYSRRTDAGVKHADFLGALELLARKLQRLRAVTSASADRAAVQRQAL
jgi:hypothetical protein